MRLYDKNLCYVLAFDGDHLRLERLLSCPLRVSLPNANHFPRLAIKREEILKAPSGAHGLTGDGGGSSRATAIAIVANNCVAPMKEIFTTTPRISQERFIKTHYGLS
jgi:hypothetical protein